METVKAILTHPFFWGFVLGFFLCALSVLAHFKTKRELKRLKGHLGDKLEIEAEKMAEMKSRIETLREENDNLRLKINSGRVQDDLQTLDRELEIYARAEKAMVMNAPGFAQAWERAKEAALEQVEQEDAGKSLPRRIFKKFFAKGGAESEAETVSALPSESTTVRTAGNRDGGEGGGSEGGEGAESR